MTVKYVCVLYFLRNETKTIINGIKEKPEEKDKRKQRKWKNLHEENDTERKIAC